MSPERQLRKTLGGGKNEPGAVNFHYGEMEMRRHDTEAPLIRTATSISVARQIADYDAKLTPGTQQRSERPASTAARSRGPSVDWLAVNGRV
ncbi:hypothetical protein ACWGDS_42520 [Streptomyces sp. NPDC055059]